LTWSERAVFGGFLKHGVKVEPIRSDYAMMRYLLDHATKSKQAQLGYKGRQWGYINRANFVVDDGSRLRLDDRARVYYLRAVANLSRYTLNQGNHAKAVFGSHKSPRRRVEGVRYGITPRITQRLKDWADDMAAWWIFDRMANDSL
jgi:hypothetical protein